MDTMQSDFTRQAKSIIHKIPQGSVITYGLVATYAGNRRGARQVARILHSCSRKDALPWHRVINREGRISLKPANGYEIQKALLKQEGIQFDRHDRIDLNRFLWRPLQFLKEIPGRVES